MNLQTTIDFLTRLYDNPSGKNLTRLEHEAIGEALRRLREMQDGAKPVAAGSSKSRLRLLRGGKTGVRPRDQRDT
jgi:hypothetical protein